MKKLLKMFLSIVFLFSISLFTVGCGTKKQNSSSHSTETESKKAQNLLIETHEKRFPECGKASVINYYGKFDSGAIVALMTASNMNYDLAIWSEWAADCVFVYPDSNRITVLYDDAFYVLPEAYENGYLTKSDIAEIVTMHREIRPYLYGDEFGDFYFSLKWGTHGISSYDSLSRKLIKTNDASNLEDYMTYYYLTDDELSQIYALILDLDMLSYPDDYNPTEGMATLPSEDLELRVFTKDFHKMITAENVAFSEPTSTKGKKFMDILNEIIDILEGTDAWKSLPDYPYLYD